MCKKELHPVAGLFEYSLIIGAPARVIRPLDAAQIERMARPAETYVAQSARYNISLRRIG
jgi:carbonic anhydrase/acetyltransferase-like protein (isoleucine patch superfamily)